CSATPGNPAAFNDEAPGSLELCRYPVEKISVPKGLRAELAMFCSSRGAIVNLCRDASGRCKRCLELAYLLNRDEVVLGACQNEHIPLDQVRYASKRVLVQFGDCVEWMLSSQRPHPIANGPREAWRLCRFDSNHQIDERPEAMITQPESRRGRISTGDRPGIEQHIVDGHAVEAVIEGRCARRQVTAHARPDENQFVG